MKFGLRRVRFSSGSPKSISGVNNCDDVLILSSRMVDDFNEVIQNLLIWLHNSFSFDKEGQSRISMKLQQLFSRVNRSGRNVLVYYG